MRNCLNIFCILIAIALFACDDTFSPKGVSGTKYAVICILDADSSNQQLAISRMYNVEGYDPYVYADDPTVKGASVKINYRNADYYFTEEVVEIPEGDSRFRPSTIYSINNFSPNKRDEVLTLQVETPDGHIITGTTSTPGQFAFDYAISDRLFPNEGDSINIYWVRYTVDNYYAPRLLVNYYKEETPDSFSYHSIEVKPHPFFQAPDGRAKPSNSDHINYRAKDINNAFISIAGDDPDKSKYYIPDIKLEVLVFESDLAAYYVTSNPAQSDYIVIIDEVDYSNLSDGIGIFGVYKKEIWNVHLLEEYITSFGYKRWNK